MRAGEFLDKPTLTAEQVAKKHGVSIEYVNQQLVDGVKHEHEHTSNSAIAREIALDHLGEDPDYYKKLSKVEKVDEQDEDDMFAPSKEQRRWEFMDDSQLYRLYDQTKPYARQANTETCKSISRELVRRGLPAPDNAVKSLYGKAKAKVRDVFKEEDDDDMFAPSKDLARRMAVMIAAGKEIWVKDSRNDVWKINKVERDPSRPDRWLARWDFGEFVISDSDYELRPTDGHTYWLDPISYRESTTLEEGASSILYHYTSPAPALRIMQAGAFELTSSVGSPQETKFTPKGYPYYLSTTRTKLGDYHARTPGSHAVMFVLNGTKIAHNYKVKPVDYWEGMWQRDNSNQRTRESEDRVYSKTPTIPIDGIIKEIHQLVSDQDEFRSPIIRKMAILAKTQGIPIYFYADTQGWLLQDPNRRFNVGQLPSRFKGQAKQGFARSSRRITPLEQWVELLYKKNKSELSPEASQLRHNLVYYGARYPQEDNQLGIELANARKPNEPNRALADRIIQFLRKNNMTTVDFKNAMVAKWEKAP